MTIAGALGPFFGFAKRKGFSYLYFMFSFFAKT